MIFRINLSVCVVFLLGALGIVLLDLKVRKFTTNDMEILKVYLYPVLLWAFGAWVSRKREGSSAVWFVTSILLMVVLLFALYCEFGSMREEATTHEYTQHIIGPIALALQWVVGVPVVVILAVIELFQRGKSKDHGLGKIEPKDQMFSDPPR
jgi:hypothetical protein